MFIFTKALADPKSQVTSVFKARNKGKKALRRLAE